MKKSELIHEFVQLMLSERIRKSGEFNINQFKELDEPFRQVAYVDGVLKELGRGSSRWTYLLSSGKVLKIASPWAEEKGRAQNAAEIELASNPRVKDIVTRIFSHHPNNDWIIAELVRPLTGAELKKTIGMDIRNLLSFAYEAYEKNVPFEDIIKDKPRIARLVPPKAREFVDKLVVLIDSADLIGGDLEEADHWGKAPDGRIVLLDYGATFEVFDTHYKESVVDQDSKTRQPE